MPSQFGMIERTLDHIRPLYIICNLINVQVRFFFNKHIWRCGDPRQTAINMHKTKNHQTLSCKPLKAGVNMCTFRDEWMKISPNQNDITHFQAGASDLTDRHYPIGQWTGHVTVSPENSKPRSCLSSHVVFAVSSVRTCVIYRWLALAQNQMKKPKHETAVYHRCHHCRHRRPTNQRGV